MQEEKEALWKRLNLWQYNIEYKISRESYFQLCETIGDEPNPDKIPPELEDFPLEVQQAIVVFGKLGDRIAPDIGYLGKDYSAIDAHIDALKIDNRELFLETLVRLDHIVIEKSAEEMKRERDKQKKKNNGGK